MGNTHSKGLFSLFININLELGLSNKVAKFVDDNQLFRMVNTQADCEELPKNLFMMTGHKMENEV